MVLSLPPVAGTVAGPVMRFSENHRFRYPTIGCKCGIYLLFINIQIDVYFYPASLQRKFQKHELMKPLEKKQFIHHYLFPATVSLC